jgi:prepilin-type processing-associated H-X9-DG protein
VNSDWRDRLAEYDDEQLDERERAALDLLVNNDLEARAYLAALRADRQRLREAFSTVRARPGFTDAVMARVAPPRRVFLWRPRVLEVCAAVLMVITLGSAMRERRALDSRVACENNLRDLTRSVLTYAQDYDDHLPDADRWVAQVEAHSERALPAQCPADTRPADSGSRTVSYGMTAGLSGARIADVPDPGAQLTAFDAVGPWLTARHGTLSRRAVANAGFLDGHVGTLAPSGGGR